MELSKAAETLSLNRFGNSAFLLIRILIGALILLVTVTISSASFNPSRASIAVLPNHTSLTNALNTRQTQTKARLCRAEALSEESSEHCRDCSADKAIDGDLNTRWSSKFQDPQWITVTLCEEKTINQVVLYWETAYARYYQLQVSQDGETWYKVFSTHNGDGGEDVITFEPITARYVRMCGFLRGTQWGYSLWEFEVFEANDPPVVPISCPLISKGYYPRWFYKELGYWTVVGSPGSYAENLFSDDGMIGNPRNGFSLIPYLKIAGKLITAFDTMTITHFLEDEYLPFPEVRWSYGDIEFKQKVFPYQAGAGDSQNYVW
ncbi:MAG: discoidin domain-containing protein, partial [Candidatus Methanomethyliaceae archaeon]